MLTDRAYLLSLQAVRQNAAKVFDAAKQGELNHFDYDPSRMADVANFVTDVIQARNKHSIPPHSVSHELELTSCPQRDFGPDKFETIPPHGRWQHFNVGNVQRISSLLEKWDSYGLDDATEVTRRIIDLFFVSVLLDAGAGDDWRFKEPAFPGTEKSYTRSEGIAVASLHMFKAGAFVPKDAAEPHQVNGQGLLSLTEEVFNEFFQISDQNPMVGVASRVQLLNDVGASLLKLPEIFGEAGRPGNLVDYLAKQADGSTVINYEDLWSCLQQVLIPSWPKDRTSVDGQPLGDAWPLAVLAKQAEKEGDTRLRSTIQPFHKLTQWLAYSLMVPFVKLLGYTWTNAELGTGLPEYRNGGLFYDLGVLSLKENTLDEGKKTSGQELPAYDAASDVIVEWRAMTVALLDELHSVIGERFAQDGYTLTMAQMLEAGSWKSGRELAAKFRPNTKSSPILVIGDGTLY